MDKGENLAVTSKASYVHPKLHILCILSLVKDEYVLNV